MSVEDLWKKLVSTIGPWGGQNGQHWDDGVFSTVKQIVIAHGAGIDYIQIEYDKDGKSVWSVKHGGQGANKTDKVQFDYPDEHLISIQGTYGSWNQSRTICVRSLNFQSNKRIYGPFGVESGTSFSLPKSEKKIVGFHGKSGRYLDSIGVHLKPFDFLKALVQPTFHVANENEKLGYSMIQGSVGQKYDIVVAVKQRDPVKQRDALILSSSSEDSSDSDTKVKKVTFAEKKHTRVEGLTTYGPWGGTGGTMFDDGIYTGIRQINLSRNVGIVSMKVCYDRNGQAVWGSKHGGKGGFKHDKIIFDYPSEVITHITGTYCSLMYMGPYVIRSLTFYTNKGKHGPFGEEHGPSFTNKADEGKIVGFIGREGLFLDAIGFHVMECKVTAPKPSLYNAIVPHNSQMVEIDNTPWSNKLVLANRGVSEAVASGVVKESAPCGPGPWGGEGGKPWDDGVYSGIKQIFITREAAGICSIQIEYDRNGQSVWSVKHGSNGPVTHRIKLEHPNEVVASVSGYYDHVSNTDASKVLKSLTVYTSRGKYGPYGEEMGTFFMSSSTKGKIMGFHGRSGHYLVALGVHMQHWLGNQKGNNKKSSSYFSRLF